MPGPCLGWSLQNGGKGEGVELLRSSEGFPAATKLGAMGAKDTMSREGQFENLRDRERVQPGRAFDSEDKQGAVLRVRGGSL